MAVKQLYKKLVADLSSEFPELDRNTVKGIILVFSGARRGLSFSKFYDEMTSNKSEFKNEKDRDDYVYKLIMISARKLCENEAGLSDIKLLTQEVISEFKDQRQCDKKRKIDTRSYHCSGGA